MHWLWYDIGIVGKVRKNTFVVTAGKLNGICWKNVQRIKFFCVLTRKSYSITTVTTWVVTFTIETPFLGSGVNTLALQWIANQRRLLLRELGQKTVCSLCNEDKQLQYSSSWAVVVHGWPWWHNIRQKVNVCFVALVSYRVCKLVIIF
jgi:hypothetical protein